MVFTKMIMQVSKFGIWNGSSSMASLNDHFCYYPHNQANLVLFIKLNVVV